MGLSTLRISDPRLVWDHEPGALAGSTSRLAAFAWGNICALLWFYIEFSKSGNRVRVGVHEAGERAWLVTQ
jgi:hypothetical protein